MIWKGYKMYCFLRVPSKFLILQPYQADKQKKKKRCCLALTFAYIIHRSSSIHMCVKLCLQEVCLLCSVYMCSVPSLVEMKEESSRGTWLTHPLHNSSTCVITFLI